jgi:uncharacterized damage-inducible protein DinB
MHAALFACGLECTVFNASNVKESTMDREAETIWAGLQVRTPSVLRVVESLSEEQMLWLPENGKNCIGWLLWHITQVEDNWIRDKLLGQPRRYPFGVDVREAKASQIPPKAELLKYFHEVRALTRERLEQLTPPEFEREIQDERYGRLTVRELWAYVVTSCAWHSGQISMLNGLLSKT